MADTTRARAAFLRKNGFTKSPMSLTRTAVTYRNEQGCSVSLRKGAAEGAPFIILGGKFGFNSSLLHIANTSGGAAHALKELRDDGNPDVPAIDRDDAGGPEWYGELFRALIKINAQ